MTPVSPTTLGPVTFHRHLSRKATWLLCLDILGHQQAVSHSPSQSRSSPPSGLSLTNRWRRGLLLPHVPFFQKLTSSVFPSSSYPLASTPATAPSITGIIITEYQYISSHSYPVGIPTLSPRPPQSILALPEATLQASCSGSLFISQEVHSWSLATTDTSGDFPPSDLRLGLWGASSAAARARLGARSRSAPLSISTVTTGECTTRPVRHPHLLLVKQWHEPAVAPSIFQSWNFDNPTLAQTWHPLTSHGRVQHTSHTFNTPPRIPACHGMREPCPLAEAPHTICAPVSLTTVPP